MTEVSYVVMYSSLIQTNLWIIDCLKPANDTLCCMISIKRNNYQYQDALSSLKAYILPNISKGL